MYQFHIDEISVNTARGPLSILPKKINVLVGPNNAGKSRLLREIRDYLSGDMLDLKIFGIRFRKACLNWMRRTISRTKWPRISMETGC